MDKGVEGLLSGGARGIPDTRVATDRADSPEERVIRRRRRHHHRHENLAYPTGRAKEIFFVTVLALAILFGILYYLLPQYQARSDESSGVPATAAPSMAGLASSRSPAPAGLSPLG